MNRCKQIRRLLSLFATDDLDEAAARRVRLHLPECPECRQHAAELYRSRTALEALRQAPEESGGLRPLWPELSQRIARLRQEEGGLKGWIPVAALAAACLAVYMWGSGWSPPDPTHPETQVATSTRDGVADTRPEDRPASDVPKDLRWMESKRARPVLPEARPVTLRSRQF